MKSNIRSPTKIRYSAWLNSDQLAAMKIIRKRTGIPVAEQIRRAIDERLKHVKNW